MRKRKRGRCNLPIDLDPPPTSSSIGEAYGLVSKHRSCWLHIVACKSSNNSLNQEEIEKLESFKFTSPCMLWLFPFPRRERSNRKIIGKNVTSGLTKELHCNQEMPDSDRKRGSDQKKKIDTKRKLDSDKVEKRIDSERKLDSNKVKKMDSGSFDGYLQNLWRSFSEDKKISFTYLDCIWFTLYLKASFKTKVLTWIKKKHIFSNKYVFVPIVCWRHWSLVIFCHFGESLQSEARKPCMLLLDSLENANPKRLEPNIRKFVLDIYKAEGRSESKDFIYKIPLLVPKVPQQRNDVDCGKYVLYFIDSFIKDAPENFSIADYPYFMKTDWFTSEALDQFCEKLDLIGEG